MICGQSHEPNATTVAAIHEAEFRAIIAQLRHAYSHLAAERVTQQKEFADGLIAPQIRRLEKIVTHLEECQSTEGSSGLQTGTSPQSPAKP